MRVMAGGKVVHFSSMLKLNNHEGPREARGPVKHWSKDMELTYLPAFGVQ